MQDKEVRFGIADTALWATVTTDASNGSVNGGHDAFTPFGGAVPLVNIFFGEVIWGGVGSGLYGMFFYILIAVFVAGLMVGRTPEYLGKKIEAREIKLAPWAALFVPLDGAGPGRRSPSSRTPAWRRSTTPAPTGSARRCTPTRRSPTTTAARSPATAVCRSPRTWAAVALYLGRFVPLLAALAVGGTLAGKKTHPESAGTFRTDGPTFAVLLVGDHRAHRRPDDLPRPHLGPIVEGLS